VRAALGKGLADFVAAAEPDILCLQETKAHRDQVDMGWLDDGYHQFWNSAEKKGYSGTAIFSKKKPLSVSYGFGKKEHDGEGRVITLEFPSLLNLVEKHQFDTVYHEHLSYLSLLSAERILGTAGLRVFDIDQLETHGGSLRIYACHQQASHPECENVAAQRAQEQARGMDEDDFYKGFQAVAQTVKNKNSAKSLRI